MSPLLMSFGRTIATTVLRGIRRPKADPTHRAVSIYRRDIDLLRTERRLRASMQEPEALLALLEADKYPDLDDCAMDVPYGRLIAVWCSGSVPLDRVPRVNGMLVFAVLYKLRGELIKKHTQVYCRIGDQYLEIRVTGTVNDYFYKIEMSSAPIRIPPLGSMVLVAHA